MRDIRNDLQERTKLVEGQISSAYAHFEKIVEQLQSEHEARVAGFKSELAAIGKVMEAEHRRMGNPPQASASPKPSLADFTLRKLNEIGEMSADDLCNLAIEEGYLPDSQSAGQTIFDALTDLARQERLRHLPDGNFAPLSLSQAIRLRRMI